MFDGGKVEDESRVVEVVTTALSLDGDVNAVNQAGDTALHGAAALGYDQVVQLLADKGAQLNVKNARGHTPLAALTLVKGPVAAAGAADSSRPDRSPEHGGAAAQTGRGRVIPGPGSGGGRTPPSTHRRRTCGCWNRRHAAQLAGPGTLLVTQDCSNIDLPDQFLVGISSLSGGMTMTMRAWIKSVVLVQRWCCACRHSLRRRVSARSGAPLTIRRVRRFRERRSFFPIPA